MITDRPTGTWVRRGDNRYAIVLNTRSSDGKRKQKWITFHATAKLTKAKQDKEADAKLAEILAAQEKGTYIEPSKLTVIAYLEAWLEQSVKPPMRTQATYDAYESLIRNHIATSSLAAVPLQRLRSGMIERFYAELKLSPASVGVLHAIFSKSMRKAVKDGLIATTPVIDLERVKSTPDHHDAREHCWTLDETRRVLAAAKQASPQLNAFIALALDIGARKNELYGLTWDRVHLDTAKITIDRQLDGTPEAPTFRKTKNKKRRQPTITPETVAAMRGHKAAQSELKMKNRTVYADFGLVFAKEEADLQTPRAKLGQPIGRIIEDRVHHLVKQADVRRIKLHGLRHTCATISLMAGTSAHVVSERIGDTVDVLLRTYAHVLPSQQDDAAARLRALLHG